MFYIDESVACLNETDSALFAPLLFGLIRDRTMQLSRSRDKETIPGRSLKAMKEVFGIAVGLEAVQQESNASGKKEKYQLERAYSFNCLGSDDAGKIMRKILAGNRTLSE